MNRFITFKAATILIFSLTVWNVFIAWLVTPKLYARLVVTNFLIKHPAFAIGSVVVIAAGLLAMYLSRHSRKAYRLRVVTYALLLGALACELMALGVSRFQ